MAISRRQILRLLRVRNLLMLTLIALLLYIVKLLNNLDAGNQFSNQALEVIRAPLRFRQDKDLFVPANLNVSKKNNYLFNKYYRIFL